MNIEYADYYSDKDIEILNSHEWQPVEPIAYCNGDFICTNCGILLMRCKTVYNEDYYCLRAYIDIISCDDEIIRQVLE